RPWPTAYCLLPIAWDLRQQRQALNIPRQMEHCGVGCQNRRAPGSEAQPDEILSGNTQAGLLVGRDAHNAALARERGGDVEIAAGVESHPLRSSQAAEKYSAVAVRIDSVDGIVARRCRARDIQTLIRSEGQMVCRHARLQRRRDEGLTIARDFKD